MTYKNTMKSLLLAILPLFIIPVFSFAQETSSEQTRNFMKEYLSYYDSIQNFRPYDQRGINVFETPKDNVTFQGLRVRFGAGFTQQFQNLKHKNYLTGVSTVPDDQKANSLYKLSAGFNTAQANLNMDVQLADGIRLHLVTYLSSRHHNEAWVKGGYIQFDKLPFKGQFWSDLMDVVTVKVGHMEINYGDAHFRRSDGGSTLYNPFMENYIIDAFTTEIGGEVYAQHNGLFGMIGVTNGEIKGNVQELNPSTTDGNPKKSPAVYAKAGYDKQFTDKFRFRMSGSYYADNSSANNTLFWGDRTGSNYFMVMENTGANATAQAWSGRVNPRFSDRTKAMMLNGFVKYGGLELFGTYETGSGRQAIQVKQEDRDFTQFAVDAVYRFNVAGKENLFLGARYNTVTLDEIFGSGSSAVISEVGINRTAIAAGWFLTRNVLLKGEYVTQKYNDYNKSAIPNTIYRNGKFNGYVIEAVVGF